MFIQIVVPYTKNEIWEYQNEYLQDLLSAVSTPQRGKEDIESRYAKDLKNTWEKIVHEATEKLDIATATLLSSPNMRLILECVIRQRVQRFVAHCGETGYGLIPGWMLVMENIGTTMQDFEVEFTFKAE